MRTSNPIRTLAKKRSVQITAVVLLTSTIALAVTNPSNKEDYINYASTRLTQEFKQDLEAIRQECSTSTIKVEIGVSLSLPTSSLCNPVIEILNWGGQQGTKLLIKNSTLEPQNFLIFSIYTTQIEIPTQESKIYKTIGIGGQFFTFYGSARNS